MSEPEVTWSEGHRRNLEIGIPPVNVTLRPENCPELWPEFILKHGLRQKVGEQISSYLTRFCRNIEDFPEDWEYFPCPETAQALFCLGGFRNVWLRGLVERGCQIPSSIREIKACLVDLIPYIAIAQRERKVRNYRTRKGLPRHKNLKIYPWEYMNYPEGDSVLKVAIAIWTVRKLEPGEVVVRAPHLLT